MQSAERINVGYARAVCAENGFWFRRQIEPLSEPPYEFLSTPARGQFEYLETILAKKHQTEIPKGMSKADFFGLVGFSTAQYLVEAGRSDPLDPNPTVNLVEYWSVSERELLNFSIMTGSWEIGGHIYLPLGMPVGFNRFRHLPGTNPIVCETLNKSDFFQVEKNRLVGYSEIGKEIIARIAQNLKEITVQTTPPSLV
jgi:hypothetical protein